MKKQFLLIILPTILILVFLGAKLYTVSSGEEILLKTAPVSSTYIFRGDYGILNYEISRVNASKLSPDYNFSRGESIYAVLSKKEKFWTIDSINRTKPGLNENQVCMEGKVTGAYNDSVSVEWGIENYFIPEEKRKMIESQMRAENVSVIVSVSPACSTVVKNILINNEPLKI